MLPARRRRALWAAVFLAWPAMLVAPSGPSMSDSVLLAAIRLVERGTWTISDESDPKTVFLTEAYDISVHGGRIYSGVGPGASVIAAPFYFVLRPLFERFDESVVASRRFTGYYLPNSRGLGRRPAAHLKDVYLLQIALVWCVMAPLFASFLLRLRDLLISWGAGEARAAAVTWAAGLGSLTLYYSSMYSRQGLACLLAWHGVLSLLPHRVTTGAARPLLAGTLLGAAFSIDYPAAIMIAAALAFLLPRIAPRQRLLVLAPIAAALALVALYHQSAFGSPLATPYHARYWFTPEVLARQGIDLAAFQEGRALGFGPPDPAVMARLCFGTFKGLFVYCPVLLLGFAGLVGGAVRRELRWLRVGCLAVFVAYLAFNAALGTQVAPEHARHFWGGLSVLWGPRYLLAAVPFLAAGLLALDFRRAPLRIACVALLVASCAVNLLGTMFSDVLMSTNAFGRDLEFPLAHALRLLHAQGPRVPLLASYGVAGWIQTALLASLVVLSAACAAKEIRRPRREDVP